MKANRRADRGEPTGPATEPIRCATCGRVLGQDRDDEPRGDAGKPICGERNRTRNFDVLFGDEEQR